MTDTTNQPIDASEFEAPVGASVWEQEMLRYLGGHVTREDALLEEYEYVAEHTRSEALRFLMRILVDDERRHHRWFRDLAESLRNQASLSRDPSPIPALDIDRFDAGAVDALVERMIDAERHDAAALRALRKELRDVADTTLWALLVELMQRDTDKHIEILRFVQQHSALRV